MGGGGELRDWQVGLAKQPGQGQQTKTCPSQPAFSCSPTRAPAMFHTTSAAIHCQKPHPHPTTALPRTHNLHGFLAGDELPHPVGGHQRKGVAGGQPHRVDLGVCNHADALGGCAERGRGAGQAGSGWVRRRVAEVGCWATMPAVPGAYTAPPRQQQAAPKPSPLPGPRPPAPSPPT